MARKAISAKKAEIAKNGKAQVTATEGLGVGEAVALRVAVAPAGSVTAERSVTAETPKCREAAALPAGAVTMEKAYDSFKTAAAQELEALEAFLRTKKEAQTKLEQWLDSEYSARRNGILQKAAEHIAELKNVAREAKHQADKAEKLWWKAHRDAMDYHLALSELREKTEEA